MPVFHMLGAHSAGNVARIPDGSLDLLYLAGEVTPDWLATALRHWMPKLRDGAVVCGDLFGLPHWREATFSLSLLLGAPDGVAADGCWWKRMRAADWKLAPVAVEVADFTQKDGVLLVNRAKETLEKLLLSLHSVTRHWAGPVAVYHWGEEDPSLTIACARLGVALWNVGSLSAVEEAETWLEAAAAIQPFRRALMLQPGMLAVGELAPLFEDGMPITEETDATPLLAERGGALVAVRGASAGKFAGEAAILVCAGEPDGWTDDAWAAWSQAEAGMAQALAGEVRVAADATVVTIVEAEMAGDFQRACQHGISALRRRSAAIFTGWGARIRRRRSFTPRPESRRR